MTFESRETRYSSHALQCECKKLESLRKSRARARLPRDVALLLGEQMS